MHISYYSFLIVPIITASQPNILLIVIDDLRPTLSSYGYPLVITPHIDNLARKSVIFTKAYAQQALCGPSRTSFLTSRRPDTTRLYDVHSYWRTAVGNYTTLPQHFKEKGYHTTSYGKIFHPGVASGKTYDYPYSWSSPPYIPSTLQYKMKKVCPDGNGRLQMNVMCPVNISSQPEGTLPDIQSTQAAIGHLKELSANQTKPFFMAVGYYKPHIPFKFPEEYLNVYPLSSINLAPNPYRPVNLPEVAWNPWADIRRRDDVKALNISWPYGPVPSHFQRVMRQGYYASLTYVDDLIGELLSAVEKYRFSNNTIIALLGDHGWSLGEHQEWSKYSNFEVSTRVPLMFSIPGITYMPDMSPSFQHSPYRVEDTNLMKIKQKALSYKSTCNTDQFMVSDDLVELVDVFPTLVDLAGIVSPPLCPKQSFNVDFCTEGQSLTPLIFKTLGKYYNSQKQNLLFNKYENYKNSTWKSAAFSQYPRPSVHPQNNSDQCRLQNIKVMGYSMRTAKYRYTEWVRFYPSNFTIEWSNLYGRELYLHEVDPEENHNVADNLRWKHLVSELSEKLHLGWRFA